MIQKPDNVQLSEDGKFVRILDQTQLPNEEVFLNLSTREALFEAIFELRVRGAPAIGIFAGFAIYVLANQFEETSYDAFYAHFQKEKDYLNTSRPTAVNLSWALERMDKLVQSLAGEPVAVIKDKMREEATEIQAEDIRMCEAIAKHGLSLLKEGDGLLTHCNAGPIATSLYGTALGPMILAHEQGMNIKVFADETRPLLQGARLTTYELDKAGVDVTVICDNMASIVMKNGWIQACLVGCDRVAKNGDTANKIGTSGVAILAKHYDIPFYVLGPTSTIDLSCETGDDIEIEERDPNEIKEKFYEKPMAPASVKAYNPAFDVTDHSLITAIVTEKGIVRAPYTESIPKLFTY